MWKKIAVISLAVAFIFALLLGTAFYLDSRQLINLPDGLRQATRELAGYCYDDNQVYRDGESVTFNDGCTICLCRPDEGGLFCTEIPDLGEGCIINEPTN